MKSYKNSEKIAAEIAKRLKKLINVKRVEKDKSNDKMYVAFVDAVKMKEAIRNVCIEAYMSKPFVSKSKIENDKILFGYDLIHRGLKWSLVKELYLSELLPFLKKDEKYKELNRGEFEFENLTITLELVDTDVDGEIKIYDDILFYLEPEGDGWGWS